MKHVKLLLLATMVMACCTVNPASAICVLGDGIGPSSGNGYYVAGDTIQYEISLTATGCTYTDTTIYFFAPDNPPSDDDPCGDLASGVVIATGVTLADGVPQTWNSGDNAALAYLVKQADLEDGDGPDMVAWIATEGNDGVRVLCDEAVSVVIGRTPGIDIEKEGSILDFCLGDTPTVIYTYYVQLDGDEDLENVGVEDDECGPVIYDSGDDGDGILEDGETWIYTCEVEISETTENIATATGFGVDTGTEVEDSDNWIVEALEPPTVVVDPAGACVDGEPVLLCAVPSGGSGQYLFLWDTGEETECIEVDEPGEYCVIVIDEVTGCEAEACAIVDVDPELEITPPQTICVGDCTDLTVTASGGSGSYSYLWSTGATTDTIEVCDAGIYSVVVTDDETGCEAETSTEVSVNPGPECELVSTGDPICPSEGGNLLGAIVTPGDAPIISLVWSIEGAGWEIVDGQGTELLEYSVAPDAVDCATFTLTVEDADGCTSTCDIELCCQGDTFCTFTQGFYGNAGGIACDGRTTTEIIEAALSSGPVVIGIEGVRHLKFNNAQCIIDLLPAGGPAKILPNIRRTCNNVPGSLTKKDGRLNNVLIGQLVALSLNARLNTVGAPCIEDGSPLGSWVLPARFCTINEEGDCPEQHWIPASMVGKTVNEFLAEANIIMGGGSVAGVPFKALYNTAANLNEAFDECRSVVACPDAEICDNGCDDDFDGLVDLDDPDCAPD